MRRPERRNRKSGTKDFGWRAQNTMRVPEPHTDRYGEFRNNIETIEKADVREILIQDHEMTLIYEHPRHDAGYPCSPDDVIHLLAFVPEQDLEGLDIIAFRQPTRTQENLESAWGRLQYFADFRYASGSAIVLEAQDLNRTIKHSKKVSVEWTSEMERLRKDGHHFEQTQRDYIMQVSPETARNTVLYRTVLHELGHWVDYVQKVRDSDSEEKEEEYEEWKERYDLYWSRPSREHEDFAHRYAEEVGAKLREQGIIPFDPR